MAAKAKKSKQGGSNKKKSPDYDMPDKDTRFKPGNKFWEARSSHGRNPIFTDPEILRDACIQYFQWVDENPLHELKVFSTGLQVNVPKMRMMTIQGLCLYIGIDDNTWASYRNKPDLRATVAEMESVISQQKLTGSAADLLNANIVCREMGLRDKIAKEVSGPDGGPVKHQIVDMPPEFKSIDDWVKWQKTKKTEGIPPEQEETDQ